jgi:hypothetical protein
MKRKLIIVGGVLLIIIGTVGITLVAMRPSAPTVGDVDIPGSDSVVKKGCHYTRVYIDAEQILSHKEDCPNPKHR